VAYKTYACLQGAFSQSPLRARKIVPAKPAELFTPPAEIAIFATEIQIQSTCS
jgi:hypothetical protein